MSKKNKKNEVHNACEQELQGWKDKFVRVSADLENFRRRIDKEKLQWMQVAKTQVVKSLLTILDDFDRATGQRGNQEIPAEIKDIFTGFEMIGKSFHKVLQEYELEEITETESFDPELHEAIAQLDSDDHESGQIIEVVQKGYRIKDQVIRPSKVTVAK